MGLKTGRRQIGAALALAAAFGATAVQAADKVRVGVFPVSSALPYFVAVERGYFKEAGIEPEAIKFMGGPPIIGAMITGDLDATSNLVMLEGMNANTKKPGVVTYISLNGQSKRYRMEQYVARADLGLQSLEEVKGAKKPLKVMSAPGPGNLVMARAILQKLGLKEGSDFTMTELAQNLHAEAMKAGTFDLGYTLEPTATMINGMGAAKTIEAGVISRYVLGRDDAQAFASGAAVTQKFLTERPDVARRFAHAWRKALVAIATDPSTRELLKGNTFTPPEVATTVPMPNFVMIGDMSAQERTDLQALVDFGSEAGLLDRKVDAATFTVALDKPTQ
jgi:NitT/TauT family transport system substrate-binding protein